MVPWRDTKRARKKTFVVREKAWKDMKLSNLNLDKIVALIEHREKTLKRKTRASKRESEKIDKKIGKIIARGVNDY